MHGVKCDFEEYTDAYRERFTLVFYVPYDPPDTSVSSICSEKNEHTANFSWTGLVWPWFYHLIGLESLVVYFSQLTDNLRENVLWFGI